MANPLDNLKPITTSERGRELGRKSSRKGIPSTKVRLRRMLEITQNLTNPITGEVEGFTVAEQMDLAQIMRAREGDTKAYSTIVDRLEGKPNQTVEQDIKVEMVTPLIDIEELKKED